MFELYRAQVPSVIAQYGGRYLARGGTVEVLEGEPGLDRVVILQFDSLEAARRFYHSPDYAGLVALRRACTVSHLALIEGVAA